MPKKNFFHKISDLSKIHHRANFSDVDKHISGLNFETHFAELAAARYSCRAYSDRPVHPAMIEKILEAGRLAPTAANRQPVHVWALCSDDALARIREVHQAYGAPVVLMVGAKAADAWVRGCDGKNGAEVDAAIVMTHMMLEATEQGLGNVWIGAFDPEKAAAAFPETAGYALVGLMAVGYPAEGAAPSTNHSDRKSLPEFATTL